MATPVGHGILGLAVLHLVQRNPECKIGYWFLFGIIAGNAADLDFIAGVLVGDINYYHQGPSHSILAALVFGLIAAVVVPIITEPRWKVALVSSLAYASHLLLDMLVHDGREPIGLPLAWPISDAHWHIAPILSGIQHGVPGDSFFIFLQQVFSFNNLLAISKEALIIIPLLLVIWLLGKFRQSTSH